MDDSGLMGNLAAKTKAKVSNRCLHFVKSNLLVLLMLVGVLIGLIIGIGLSNLDPKLTQPQTVYLRFPGDIFLQLMKMLLIPVVVSSLLCSTAEIDIRSSGKIGLRALVYYVVTLVLASALAITLAMSIRPGDRTRTGDRGGSTQAQSLSSSPGLAFMDLFRNMVPDNLVEVCFSSKKTKSVTRPIKATANSSNSSVSGYLADNLTASEIEESETTLVVGKENGINMIGIVVASIVFGCITSAVGNEAKPFLDFFKALRTVTFRLVAIVIWYSPVGIAFLIAAKLSEMENPSKTFQDLGIFSLTVIAGLIIHGFLVLPLIYFVFVRKNPLRFLAAMIPAMLFAFGSESSSATLPVTIGCLERKKVDPRVTKLIASVGATVNMDGTCLYFTMMTIFVAQLHDVTLTAGQLISISILALSIAMGAAGIPGTGVIYMIMILTSMGLPTEDISTLLAVDWFLARCRTSINILGDGIGARVIEHLSRHDLRKLNLELSVVPAKANQNGEQEITVAIH